MTCGHAGKEAIKMSKTLDDTTTAAYPGRIRASVWKYVGYYPGRVWESLLWLMVGAVAFTAASMATGLPLWPGSLAVLWPIYRKQIRLWTRLKEHLEYGCICPAVVLDAGKGTVAVFTNLTCRGDDPTPVVKIYRERLGQIRTRRIGDGTRLATTTLYARNPDDPYSDQWMDFTALVVDCFTDDVTACDGALSRMRPEAWKVLEMGLAELGPDRSFGTHHVDLPPDLVNNAF